MNIFKMLLGRLAAVDIEDLLKQGPFLVDVRTAGEFARGHVNGSVNIPLDKIPHQLSDFEGKNMIIVFCRSGNRSAQGKSILEKNGFNNVINGGTWKNVGQYVK